MDDHQLVREALKSLFDGHPRWTVCGEAENGQEAVRLVAEVRPELVVLDLSMPVMNGILAAAKIRQVSPTTKIIMVSMHSSPYVTREAIRAGVDLYLTKSEVYADLMRTIDELFSKSSPPA